MRKEMMAFDRERGDKQINCFAILVQYSTIQFKNTIRSCYGVPL